jgi:hypothetical protein
MPEFDVTVLTMRTGTHTVRVKAVDAAAARGVVQLECGAGQCHCPPEWCTDDVESQAVSVRHVAQGARSTSSGESVE